ncbi:unnamed protein product [Ixodes pacificus]
MRPSALLTWPKNEPIFVVTACGFCIVTRRSCVADITEQFAPVSTLQSTAFPATLTSALQNCSSPTLWDRPQTNFSSSELELGDLHRSTLRTFFRGDALFFGGSFFARHTRAKCPLRPQFLHFVPLAGHVPLVCVEYPHLGHVSDLSPCTTAGDAPAWISVNCTAPRSSVRHF